MFSNFSKQEIFDYIVNAAKEKNIIKIKELINHNICLDMRVGIHSPLSLLAFEQNHQAVHFLLGYLMNPSSAARGYAMVNDNIALEKLFNQGADFDAAVEGYIATQQFAKARLLLSRKNFKQLSSDKAENDVTISEKLDLLSQLAIIKCLAIQGDNDAVQAYIFSEINERIKIELFSVALRGFAIGGHVDFVNDFSMLMRDNQYPQDVIDDCRDEGYVIGGHWEKVKPYRNLLSAYATAGYVQAAEKLYGRWKKGPQDKAEVFMIGLATLGLANVIFHFANQWELQSILFNGYQSGGFFANANIALRLLAFSSESYRANLIAQAKKNHLPYDIHVIASKATAIYSLMEKTNAGFNEALAELDEAAFSHKFFLIPASSQTSHSHDKAKLSYEDTHYNLAKRK